MMGWLGKNIRHHGLLTAKKNYKLAKILWNNPKKWNFDQKINDAKPLIWSCLSNNFRFSGGFSKPTKTSNKDLSHNDTFSVGLVGWVTTLYARDSQFIQTLLWLLEFVIQINLKHDTSAIQFLSKNFILQTSPNSTL